MENGNKSCLILVGFISITSLICLGLLQFQFATCNDQKNIILMEYCNQEILTNFTNSLNNSYKNEIYPTGKEIISKQIQSIKKETKNDPNPVSKLDKIFIWEMKDWHNPDPIFPIFKPIFNESGFKCYPDNTCHYEIYNNDSTRLMAMPRYEGILFPQKNPNGIWYRDDPYWIAYNKIGACREIANLFSFMANEAGIESKVIESSLLDHRWVEVNVSGEWMYYDPWCAIARHYYNPEDGNLTFKNKWFNKREYYSENCYYPPIVQRYPEYSDVVNQYLEPTFTYDIPFYNRYLAISSRIVTGISFIPPLSLIIPPN